MIRFGIIGTNSITDEFIRCGKQVQGFELTAVYSRTKERAGQYASMHGAEYIFTDVQEMLESGKVDAVYIASPNSFHASQAILCMEHGKHVLCEKPIASNCKEAEAMVQTAREKQVLLMEAMKSSFMPNVQILKREISRLGKVRRYFAQFCKYSSRYDAFLRGEKTNTFQPEFSNGALMDLGVYCIQPLVALFGMPIQIRANAIKLPSGVDGEGSMIAVYEDMEAVLLYSKISFSALPNEIQGENGSIRIDMISKPEKIVFHDRSGGSIDLSVPGEDAMVYEIREFIRLIREGKTESEQQSFEQSLNVMKIVDEARRQTGIVYPADNR